MLQTTRRNHDAEMEAAHHAARWLQSFQIEFFVEFEGLMHSSMPDLRTGLLCQIPSRESKRNIGAQPTRRGLVNSGLPASGEERCFQLTIYIYIHINKAAKASVS